MGFFNITFLNPLHKPHMWKPARWWCPNNAYFRFAIVILTVPRKFYPHRKDGKRKCNCCGRIKWMLGPPNMWCEDCKLLHRQLSGMLGDGIPSYWLHEARGYIKKLFLDIHG